jgi:hypothetical protein
MTSIVWGRIAASGDEERLVLQDNLGMSPGRYTLVVQARNEETGEIRTNRFLGTLEKPPEKRASLGPVAVFQPGSSKILRAGHALSSSGEVALASDESLDAGRETVLLASVCGDRVGSDELTVERELIGSEEVTLPITRVEPDADRCARLADRVPANAMGQGHYLYRIRVSDSEGLVAEGQRELIVDGGRSAGEPTR